MKKIFITSFCILSTVGVTSFFMPYILTTQINKNKDYIESYIKEKTNQNIHFNNATVSFNSIQLEKVEIGDKDSITNISDINLKINIFNVFNDNKLSLIKDIDIGSITVPKKESNTVITLDDIRDKALNYFPYLEYIKTIKINKINTKYNNINNVELFRHNNNFRFKLSSDYLHNLFKIDGFFDYDKFLKTKKLDSEFTIYSPKIKLNSFNSFFNQKDFSFDSGYISSNQIIKIKNNDITINGHTELKEVNLSLWNKKFKLNDNSFNNQFKSHRLELTIDKLININNIDFNIKKIIANSDENYKNIKKIIIQSNQLDYEATFSQNFYQTKKDKDFSLKFNQFDLNYLTKLGIVHEIPAPYNNALISNGIINVKFHKENGSQYDITYDVKSDAKLNVSHGFIKGKAKIENNELFIDNLYFNDVQQEGYFKYDFHTNNFYLNLNSQINQDFFNYLKEEYHLPFNIENLNNHINGVVDLKRIDKKFIYHGVFNLKNNDFAFTLKDKSFNFKNTSGTINFDTFKINDLNLSIDELYQEDLNLKSLKINGKINNNIYDFNLNTDIFSSKIHYDYNNDYLSIKIPKINYQSNQTEKLKKIVEYNAHDIDLLRSLNIPKAFELFIDDLNLNNIPLGKLEVSSIEKNENIYELHSKLENDVAKGTIISLLNLNELFIKNKVNITSDNLEKFNEKYHIDNVIKNGNLSFSGDFTSQIKNLNIQSFIDNTEGKVLLSSQNGEFTQIDTGIGFFLNVLNFNTIPHLTKLNFNNLFTNKLTYETIESKGYLKGTQLKINQLDIISSISTINSNGQINLENYDIDMNLKVTPQISNSLLFVASALNPISFISVNLIKKIFPVKAPELITYQYKVDGKLTNPKLTKK